MKTAVCAALMAVVLATPAFAANVYLKDGGIIEAKKVWQKDGKVHVLVNRDILTTFEPYEVNMKRTFVKNARPVKKLSAIVPRKKEAAANGTAALQNPDEGKKGMKLPPLPEKNPENLVPSSGSGGTIRQHKKEMSERLAE